MYFIDDSNDRQHVYPTYGRQFCTYKWFKPLITAAITGAIYMVLVIALLLICTQSVSNGISISYENLDFNNIGLSIYILGGLAVAIPALWIASKIVRDRPFSSYSSARGGWNFKVFFICLVPALLIGAGPLVVQIYQATHFNFDVELSFMGFLIILILGPLQCIAEEYIFRGVFMQTLGSWLGRPILAIIIQAVVFSFSHKYNVYGLVTIILSGLVLGFATYITRGIEASSALHIANNVPLFYIVGLHLATLSSQPGMATVVNEIIEGGLYILFLLILKKKTNLFDEVKKDDLAIWNEKHAK